MVKRFILLFVISFMFVDGFCQQNLNVANVKIDYVNLTIEEALEKAEKTKRMVMINFYNNKIGAWRLTDNYIENDTVANILNSRFINLKINLADSAKSNEVAKQFNVTDWEFVFLDENANVKYRVGGGINVINKDYFLSCAQIAWDKKNTDPANGVQFISETLENILSMGKKANNLIFIDCYTKWCVPCSMMSNQVFPLKQVGDYLNSRFVCAEFDMETPQGNEVGKRYAVQLYPTYLILNPEGEEVGRLIGKMDADDLIQKVDSLLMQHWEKEKKILERMINSVNLEDNSTSTTQETLNMFSRRFHMFFPHFSEREKILYVLDNFQSPWLQKGYLTIPLQVYLYTEGLNSHTEELLSIVKAKTSSPKIKEKVNELHKEYYPFRRGVIAPEIKLPGEDAREVRLSDFKGKYVLIDIWATWCKGCVERFPKFLELTKLQAIRDDLVLMTIAMEKDDGERWQDFLNKNGYSKKVVHLLSARDNKQFEKDYCVGGLPRYLLVDPDGKILKYWGVASVGTENDPRSILEMELK
ncbi:MAG: TlpA family protein disulfide reductase [Marinifilaceae bacterium]|nr:TlpA family protein disulfide reductase [Marinifilaceae bacterium]